MSEEQEQRPQKDEHDSPPVSPERSDLPPDSSPLPSPDDNVMDDPVTEPPEDEPGEDDVEETPPKPVDDPDLPEDGDPEDFDEEPVDDSDFERQTDIGEQAIDANEELEEPNDLSGIDKEFDDSDDN
jgi:hypothetical protein